MGWIVVGSMEIPPATYKPKTVCNLITTQQLHNEIQRFWEIEHHALKREQPELDSHDICEQHFLSTSQRAPKEDSLLHFPLKTRSTNSGTLSKWQKND